MSGNRRHAGGMKSAMDNLKKMEAAKMSEPVTSNLQAAYSDMIKLAAELARGDGVPDWSEHKWRKTTPASERTDVMCMLRGMEETVRLYAIRLKAIADKVSAEIRASHETTTAVDAVGLDELLEHLDPGYCDCQECAQCKRMPVDCSGTDCALTCNCSECDHCRIEAARTELKRPVKETNSAHACGGWDGTRHCKLDPGHPGDCEFK